MLQSSAERFSATKDLTECCNQSAERFSAANDLKVVDMDKISTTPKDIRKFGLLFAGICLLVSGYLWYRENTAWQWLAGGAGFFLVTGLFLHPVLRPIYIVWMKFAFVLAWINTRLLLGLFFFLILTPVGAIMRLFGKDFLDEKIDPQAPSYWKRREPAPFDPKRYENLF